PNQGWSERLPRRLSQEEHVRVVVELLADVTVRYGASPDVVAAGASGAIVARALVRVPRLARSLAWLAPSGFGRSRRSRIVLGPLANGRSAAAIFDALALPVCFVHGPEAEAFSYAIDRLVARHAGFRRLGVAGRDAEAVAGAL